MIEAFANNLSSYLGRHLFYWAVSQPEVNGLNLRLTELINKFHGPLERGVQVLDHLLTLEEEDFNGHWGSAYTHNYEPEYASSDGNQEVLQPASHREELPTAARVLAATSGNSGTNNNTNNNRISSSNSNMETLNNGNSLSPPYNNSSNCHHQQQQRSAMVALGAASSAGGGGSSGGGGSGSTSGTSSIATGSGEHNIQITQPISAPSSPLASPGAISTSALFCLPSSSSNAITGGSSSSGGSGSGSYVCTAGAANQSNNSATNAVDTADPNWQATKATVLERNAAMFNNELMSDVKFAVGGEFADCVQIIPAHKYILATGSSVFYAMFYGGLAENKQEIKVPDVEPSAFLTLLRYLYCDEIQLEPDNILATLYAAKKYIVPHLARACVNYLEVKLTAKNACLLLSQSRLFEEPELMQRCWEVIDAQAEMAIKSEDFVDIDLKTFESILSRETLNCKEIHLFEAALNWALNACQKMGIDANSQNKRSMLGQALHLIRMPTMTLEEFANGVAQTGILTSQETIDIFLHFTAQSKPHLSFSTRPRAGLKTQVCHRFQSCAYRSNQWRYRGRCDSIQFSVDRRIFIVGFGLYGSSTGAANYKVKIELKRLGRTLAENETKFFSDGSSNTFHVFFENPIQIEPECYYTASVILDGNELSFFGQEGMSEVCMGNVTFQFQCSSESTNGTGVQGGQIPELIFYGPTIVTALNSPTNSLCPTPIGAGSSGGDTGGSGASVGGGLHVNCDDLLGSGGSDGGGALSA
ncbi:BTB/POZ domain-containing protein 6-B isoform X1 [Anastrepha obliqua]|uniref:BTB/POZ domain-containing protein 6-B isoform X1 n=1 Tax=Anastrepha obliqua TaxID=95512 RepID=UPI0024096363|nr:BTB/POZ domain-containing protein 6-B isoform X1 [Anastrepha obliqua]XP_054726183.1 BTB/POZ domain-containing protein 6-B isoform X1 [Anastrepha obliqua]XP_054726184.1 BTB/POZ domain-containing protein 6-B isoform X1 [Anastrepha obliqua]